MSNEKDEPIPFGYHGILSDMIRIQLHPNKNRPPVIQNRLGASQAPCRPRSLKKRSYGLGRAGTDPNTGRKIDLFIFNNLPAVSFELRNDTLMFYDGAIISDGVIAKYVKISDDY